VTRYDVLLSIIIIIDIVLRAVVIHILIITTFVAASHFILLFCLPQVKFIKIESAVQVLQISLFLKSIKV